MSSSENYSQLTITAPSFIRGAENSTCLHMAAYRGGAIEAQPGRLLVEAGADLEALDNDKSTPFFLACKAGNVPLVHLLKEKGCSISTPNGMGAEPLYVAAQMGHIKVIDALLSFGADVNCRGCGTAPLHIACMQARIAVIERLINADGIDLDLDSGKEKCKWDER